MDEPMRDLAQQSYALLERESGRAGEQEFHDYSFVVFPMAKAYEGFLKKIFFDLKLISRMQYKGDRFRVGKSLNPHLPKRYAWDWVYGKLVAYCGGEGLPLRMWETWKSARNRIFHYFPDHHEFITLDQARLLISGIVRVMEDVLTGCKL